MEQKPNKPGADFDAEGKDQAVRNQSVVSPDDYPDADKVPAVDQRDPE